MKKLTKRDIKIYEGTIRGALADCLHDGRIPATLLQINQLIRNKIIPDNVWYDTRSTNFNYRFRNLSLKELQNIEDFYSLGGRVLFVLNRNYFGNLYGNDILNFDGRFVGVKVK